MAKPNITYQNTDQVNASHLTICYIKGISLNNLSTPLSKYLKHTNKISQNVYVLYQTDTMNLESQIIVNPLLAKPIITYKDLYFKIPYIFTYGF